jgi:hypothetical protein
MLLNVSLQRRTSIAYEPVTMDLRQDMVKCLGQFSCVVLCVLCGDLEGDVGGNVVQGLALSSGGIGNR